MPGRVTRAPRVNRGMRTLAAFALASLLWIAALSTVCRARVDPDGTADALARRRMSAWRQSAGNPEWDLMARAFTAWSMAELAARDPNRRAGCLGVMDEIIAQTLADESRHGAERFLLPYGRGEKKSLFVDSEVTLMLGLRRLVEEKPEYRPLFAARVAAMEK